MLKCCYSRKKYLSKLKHHGLPHILSEEFLFKCLSVMIYEQFIVSIVELIMLSWQPILLHNFHNMRVTWLFYHFFKLCRYQFDRLPSPPGTPGLLHQNVCPAPGLLHNRKCPGAGPINDDVPGAGHLHQHKVLAQSFGLKN